MSKDPAFLFYPGDYLRDTQVLSGESQVAYDRIMCEHMRNICISKQRLKFFTKRLDQDQTEEIMSVLVECPEGFQIPWVADSINKRRRYSESRRQNRMKKPQKDMINISQSYDQHMENENENVIENKNETENETFAAEIFPTFQDFWDIYDKKVGRDSCEKLWGKIKQRDRESIVDHLDKYITSTPDKTYRKNPATYLRNKGWEDEILENHLNNKTNGSKYDYSELKQELGITAHG